VLGLFSFFFLVIAAFWIQKPIRTSRFLTAIGPEYLPWVKGATALLIAPVVMLYSAVAARYRREHIVYACAAGFIISSVAFWWLFTSDAPNWSHYVYFFYVDIFNSVMVGLFWSFANDLTSPDQALREYGFVGGGGILGGIVGAALTGWTVERIGAAHLLLVCVGFLLAIAAVAGVTARVAPPPDGNGHEREASLRDAVAGARLTAGSRYLTCVALVVLLYEIVSNVIDFQFHTWVSRQYGDGAAMAAFLGRFSAASIAASLAAQFVLTTWVLRRWGPRLGLLALPIVLGLGSTAFVALPIFAVIAATFFSDATLSYSLNQSAKEILYTPVERAAKYQAKAFIDMFLMRVGKGLGALLIVAWLAWLTPLGWGEERMGLLVLAVVVAWVAVARAAARAFAERTGAAPATGGPGSTGNKPEPIPRGVAIAATGHRGRLASA